MITLPENVFRKLRAQAEAACRVPRQEAEWILQNVLARKEPLIPQGRQSQPEDKAHAARD
jgi:hypothetical protein